MYETDAIDGMVADFEETIAASIEITREDVDKTSPFTRILRQFLGLFSTLL